MAELQKSMKRTSFFEEMNCQNLWQRNQHLSVEERIQSVDKKDVDLIIDWFEFTVKGKSIYEVLQDFGLSEYDANVTVHSVGLFGYDTTFVYGEKIKFLTSSKDIIRDESERMGIHVLMSGKACREFEKKWTWYWLMLYCQVNGCNISRIDIAYDSFTDKFFTIAKVRNSLKRGNATAKAKKALEYTERRIVDGSITGETVKFGKSSSETSICFYNKLQERESANYIISKDIKHWYRCELRIRKDSAKKFLNTVLNDTQNFSIIALGVLKNYVDFKPRKDMTRNKSRKDSVMWWSSFLGECTRLQLSNRAQQTTISRKRDWLEMSTQKALAMLLIADMDSIDEMSAVDLQKFITDGMSKISKMDIKTINNHRLENGASVVSQDDVNVVKNRLRLWSVNDLPF